MGCFIDYTQTEKIIPGVQHKILIIRNYPLSLLHFYPLSFTLILVMNYSTPCPPSQKYAIDPASVCVYVTDQTHMCVYNTVSCRRTAPSWCFYIPVLLLLVSVWGSMSQLCWRSINPDRSIVPAPFKSCDQQFAPRYHFQLEKHSTTGMRAILK